jgi:hypothetical protein
MTQPNKYLIAPDFDCPPNTAILIGHILTDPTLPYEALNTDSLLPPPASITLNTTKTAFSATHSQFNTSTFNIWALGHKGDSSQDIQFEIDEIETSFIKPAGKETQEYMRSCVEDDNVQAFFDGSRFKKSVYMIVGLKIAKGAKVNKTLERSREATAKVKVDGTAGGVPFKAEPQAEFKGGRKERTEWKDQKRFVFAYRLRKITCKKGKAVGNVEYNKGAFLDLESSKGGKEEKELHYLVDEEDVELHENASKRISEVEDAQEELFILPIK